MANINSTFGHDTQTKTGYDKSIRTWQHSSSVLLHIGPQHRPNQDCMAPLILWLVHSVNILAVNNRDNWPVVNLLLQHVWRYRSQEKHLRELMEWEVMSHSHAVTLCTLFTHDAKTYIALFTTATSCNVYLQLRRNRISELLTNTIKTFLFHSTTFLTTPFRVNMIQ